MPTSSSYARKGQRRLSVTGWFLLIFCMCYLLVVHHYRHASSHDPTSFFFDPASAYERKHSARRILEAEAFINVAKNETLPGTDPKATPHTCIGIIATSLQDDSNLHLTMGSLFSGLAAEDRDDIFFNLLLGNNKHSDQLLATEDWIRNLPNRVTKYDAANSEPISATTVKHKAAHQQNSLSDYRYILDDCYMTGATYVTIFEDDILAMKGWYPRLQNAVRNVEDKMHQRRRKGQRWLYLRLFYAEALLGWHINEWATYCSWIGVVWGAVTWALFKLKNRCRRVDPSLTTNRVVAVSTLCVGLSVILYFMVGRHTVTRELVVGVGEMGRYGCCAQGLVFPREIVPDLVARMEMFSAGEVNDVLGMFAEEWRLLRWATVPPLIQHLGAMVPKGFEDVKEARWLWSFRFEEWDG